MKNDNDSGLRKVYWLITLIVLGAGIVLAFGREQARIEQNTANIKSNMSAIKSLRTDVKYQNEKFSRMLRNILVKATRLDTQLGHLIEIASEKDPTPKFIRNT
jgi:hypothetical protein